MSVAEPVQKAGMDGVELAKRWLESTTWIELPFNAYDNGPICTCTRLDGGEKSYDLFGSIFMEPHAPLYVEVKSYDSAGGKQGAEFWRFLSNAYSITARDLNSQGGDGRREFMWLTRHPFQLTDWSELTTPKRIQEALDKDPDALNGAQVDPNVLSLVSDRIWLLVFHKRQESLVLSPAELAIVEGQLNRKGKK